MPTVEKGQYGQWIVSDIVDGYRVSRQYFGYSKRNALAEFKNENGN